MKKKSKTVFGAAQTRKFRAMMKGNLPKRLQDKMLVLAKGANKALHQKGNHHRFRALARMLVKELGPDACKTPLYMMRQFADHLDLEISLADERKPLPKLSTFLMADDKA